MTFSARHLPHWDPGERTIFVTWRLHGSLPADAIKRLARRPPTQPGKLFLDIDRVLDRATVGANWLQNKRIADCVMAAIQRGEKALRHYSLQAFVIMPNHVHLLIDLALPIRRITQSLKGVIARDANAMLNRTGLTFWQDESFDHWVRTGAQRERIRMYIENNPVTAKLVEKPEDWPWSSASQSL